MLRIKINGTAFPLRLVMGALILFKRESGKDVSSMRNDDVEDSLLLMWCCVKCASQAEGIDFSLDFETFCNSITPDDVAEWNSEMSSGEKKKAPIVSMDTVAAT